MLALASRFKLHLDNTDVFSARTSDGKAFGFVDFSSLVSKLVVGLLLITLHFLVYVAFIAAIGDRN